MNLASRTYPNTRLRRTRKTELLRNLCRENNLYASDLVQPMFLVEGQGISQTIDAMPGIFRQSVDLAIESAKSLVDEGITAVALFPAISSDKKSQDGKEALNPNGLIPKAITEFKKYLPQLTIIADVALDPYTDHGQDGLIDSNGFVINDATVEVLAKQSLLLSQSGADVIAPSDMMDGRIQKIRSYLEQNNMPDTIILSYAAKYASSLYGPFRDAVRSSAALGKSDKKNYQMDPGNSNEALHEAQIDISEGADIVMVKPASFYLDIIYQLKKSFKVPVAAYQVSGEYSMLTNAINNNILSEQAIIESLISIKRAGADIIFSYFSGQVAESLAK